MKLKFQILILCLASLLLLTVFTYLSLFININRTYKTRIETLKTDLLNDKKKYLNDLVRFAHEIVKESYKDFQKDIENQNIKNTYKKNILEEEYKNKAKNFLAALRYDEGNGYFFAYELRSDDVYYAFHGVKKELWNTVPIPFDRHGYLFRKDVIKEAQKGGGYVIYVEEKPSTKRLTETIAYAEYFKEWDWVIVSSIFMQDIDKKVEILKKELTREQQKTLILFLIILLIVTFFMSIVVILVSNGIVKPLEDITDHANHVSVEGKLTTFTPKGKIMQNTEVGQLVSSFNKMTQALIEAEKSLKEQERLKKEMEIAEHIQTAILTPAPLHNEVQIAALMKPAEEVGGDYYDIIIDDNKRLWIAIGDVSGHGVTPGLIMLMAQSSFSTCVHEMGDISPKDAIISVNYLLYRNIRERLNEKHFMSMNFIKYLGNGEFVHAGAHLDIIVYRDKQKKCELIHTPGVYLGIKPDVTEHMINSYFKLEKDDLMLLYTDGVVEARKKDTKAKLYGVENLQNVLIKNYKKQLTEIIEAIIHETEEWTGAKQYDDITLVLVKKT